MLIHAKLYTWASFAVDWNRKWTGQGHIQITSTLYKYVQVHDHMWNFAALNSERKSLKQTPCERLPSRYCNDNRVWTRARSLRNMNPFIEVKSPPHCEWSWDPILTSSEPVKISPVLYSHSQHPTTLACAAKSFKSRMVPKLIEETSSPGGCLS